MSDHISRLAPSPTGALHLGNARTFLINWAIARRNGWRLLMRIEDLDGPRIKAHAAKQVLDTIRWLGMEFDDEPIYQSRDLGPYRAAMRSLAQQGLVYPCRLTRGEIEAAASAPHGIAGELRVGPQCRPREGWPHAFGSEHNNYRLVVPDETVIINDGVMERAECNPFREVGDFVVWTKRGTPAYQLAVVVDDARQGVTDVVRGVDLLPSAARQELLYRALGSTPPRWWHLPLVLGPDGRRLAKRHGDTRIESYRHAGAAPERIVGLLAYWSGVLPRREELSAADFRDRFNLDTLDRSPITFTQADHLWLLNRC